MSDARKTRERETKSETRNTGESGGTEVNGIRSDGGNPAETGGRVGAKSGEPLI
jgi:hypothetical protein